VVGSLKCVIVSLKSRNMIPSLYLQLGEKYKTYYLYSSCIMFLIGMNSLGDTYQKLKLNINTPILIELFS
jgi:hypothetical protein